MRDEKRYIIRLKKEADKKKIKNHIANVGKKVKGKGRRAPKLSKRGNFIFVDDEDLEEIKSGITDIAYIEEDQQVELFTVPNDTHYGDQWNLKNTGQFSGVAGCDMGGMEGTWTLEQGETTVIVGVCDTGIDVDHEDLVDNIWTNPSPTFGDDHGVRGINGTLDGECTDFNGHGTHVAGIIAGKGNNSKGIAGVAWNVKVMSLRFFNNGVGLISDAINVIEYGIDKGCSIINHSWGGSIYSQALADLWADANTAGVIMVCAAGNDGKNNDVWPKYPASIATPNNIAVAAFTNTGTNSYFTNYGIKSVMLSAPGGSVAGEDDTNILSTWPENTYRAIAGTSMAAPHISGALALLKSYYAGWSVANAMTLLRACITPTEDQFLITDFGGRININNLLNYSKSTGTTITKAGPTDIQITPDADDPTKNILTWTNPGGLFSKMYIHRLDNSFPDDVNPDQVEVYSSTGETCEDTGLEEGVVYGYRFQASYADAKLSLPVYVRSRGGGEKFACPVPPSGFDFICDYWDERWATLTDALSLNDVALPVQAWRAAMSKLRTRGGDAVFPNGIIGHYRTVKPEVPEVPTANDWHLDTVPNAGDLMHFQSIRDGAIFLENLIRQVKELTKPIKLYSTRLSADKWFIWLDYYRYISDGTIRKYHPPAELFEWEWEYIKLRENWKNILDVLQNVLNNMRVLYTAAPPYSTTILYLTTEQTASDECTSGELETTRNFYYPFWDDPVPTEAESTPPSPPVDPGDATKVYVTGDIDEPYINSSYGNPYYYTDDNIKTGSTIDIENVKMVNPLVFNLLKISLSMRDYTRAVWFYCLSAAKTISTHVYSIYYYYYAEDKHIGLNWDSSSPTTVLLNTPGSDGTVAYAYFGEEPESDDPDDVGYKLQIFTNHADGESTTNTPNKFPNNQKRNYFFADGKLVLNPAWDWASYPITFNVLLEFQAGNAGFEPVYAEADVDTFISPLENTDGYVTFGYEAWDTEWDDEGEYTIVEKNGSIQLNATQIYKQFGTGKGTLKIGELYIDNDTNLEWTFSMSTDLAKDTLPHLWKTKLKTESSSGYTKWWTKIYRVTGTSPIDFEELEGETPAGYTDENRYCLGRWGSISVWLKVIPDFDYFDYAPGVKPHKVPNLIGLTTDDEDTDVPYVDDFVTAWNADPDNPQVFANVVNSQAHFDAPESRIISQSPPPDTILPYGEHGVGNELNISYTISAGYPTKDADLAESYDIPKVTGMTLTEAIAYLASDYPTWEITEDGITYIKSYNVPKGLIVAQIPDWQHRMTSWSPSLAVSISLGLPDGKTIPALRGQTLTNALTALDAINCDCPESHRIAQYHATIPAGSVIAQIPSSLPYRLFPEETTNVGLVVSLGVSPDGSYSTPVPLVIGRNIDDDYLDELETAGWDIVEVPVYCEGEPGLIVDQIPRYNAAMGALDTNRLIVAVAHDQKSLVTEGAESGVKL